MRSVDYVILYVRDLGTSIAFYRDVIGIPFKRLGDGYAEFDTRPTKLGLYERARLSELIGREASGEGGPAVAVLFLVDDVDAEAKRLSAAGAEILAEPTDRPWGHRTLHVEDPDGNVVELAKEIARTDR